MSVTDTRRLIVIDGANVLHAACSFSPGQLYQIQPLVGAMNACAAAGLFPICALPMPMDTELVKAGGEPVRAWLSALQQRGHLLVAPSRARGDDDYFIIAFAVRHDAHVLSNDRYLNNIPDLARAAGISASDVLSWLAVRVITYGVVGAEVIPHPLRLAGAMRHVPVPGMVIATSAAIALPRDFSPPEAADAAMTPDVGAGVSANPISRWAERPIGGAVPSTRLCVREFSIPGAFVPRVIGRSGEMLKSIEQSTRARVSIVNGVLDDLPVGFVRISSRSQEAVDAAVAIIFGLSPLSNTASRLLVDRECIGRIVGRAGASLKALEAMTGCRIVISREDAAASGSVYVYAHGTPSGEQHALSEIKSVQNGASSYWGADL